MPRYEIILLALDGGIHGIVPLRAADDAEAERAARAETHPFWRELWAGPRLVGQYPP